MPPAVVRLFPQEVEALLRSPGGPVLKDTMKRALRVQTRAKELAPVDEGRLRASIEVSTGRDARGVFVSVGSSLEYALYVHEGTRPHFPPPAALSGWASRHGISSGYVVARAIAQRGTRPRPFLRDALSEARTP